MNANPLRKLAAVTSVAALVAIVLPAGVLAQAGPEFRLGFKALAGQLGAVAGTPTEGEHYAANGDSLQKTTTGLMVWRKADNWTAFTDGSRTWINGPNGVESRSNGERFPWEEDPAPSEEPTVAPRISLEQLSNAEYDLYGERIRLANGTATLMPRGGAWLDEEHVAFGDLNGDGTPDAAVLLGYSGGGSGTFTLVVAMLDRDGIPIQAASDTLGDRIVVRSMQIMDNEIRIRMLTRAESEPMVAPPTVEADRYYRLVDGKFRRSVQ